ncbi:phosphate acyltransferase PlsX [Clostridium tagluense]|uniref:phosphate acyltransferase PlsX n=1 Tax=Clostridium tagluense TaxID=360422 RepID=UPI001C6F285E|nr:phosphate acyltransferase PlsX [Clostridium tagluense]MBW9156377.1 phosphate acyltransferase PlsX [Clostridium tagluense]WLC64211.1 phosphate acyltransferase PlsX [Clostridium tagluense]
MVVVVDGMGGDFSPSAVVCGCVEALKEYDIDILITGSEELIRCELLKYTYDCNRIKIVDAKEVISTSEHPVMAIKRKKDSSLVKALNLVKSGDADAIISAGSTGAFLAGSTLIVGRIKGIDRPALAPIMPGKNGPFMIIDCGANAECKPHYLVQFGLMGKTYFENILKISNPSVGLVNIGTEEEKGNELSKSAHKLLKEANLNFVGNVEAREIPTGDTNILVCDGFVGNVILKLYEGAVANIFDILKTGIMSSFRTKLGGMLLKPVFKKFKADFDYKEYGGAAFLGVNGICIKAHGSSDAKAFKNAIKQAVIFNENNVVEKLKLEIEKLSEQEKNISNNLQ